MVAASIQIRPSFDRGKLIRERVPHSLRLGALEPKFYCSVSNTFLGRLSRASCREAG